MANKTLVDLLTTLRVANAALRKDLGEGLDDQLFERALVRAAELEPEEPEGGAGEVQHCLGLLADITRRAAAAANENPEQDALCISVKAALAITAERRRAQAVLSTMSAMEDALQGQIADLRLQLLAAKKGGAQ